MRAGPGQGRGFALWIENAMKVTLQPSGAVLDVERGERILDAARRLGYDCPQSCRNGNCHICASLLVNGRVRQAGQIHDHGEVFACLAEPEEECVLLWDGVLAPGELPMRELNCQLIACDEGGGRSEEHTSELQSQSNLVC